MHLQLGDLSIDVVRDGTFRLDGGAMFGVVPKPLWSRLIESDDRNRIPLALNCLLVRTRDDVILVDTGMGEGWTEKERDIYALDNRPGLVHRLGELGVTPGDVTRVINTHLHFDHAGGNTVADGGEPVPAFPNAVYMVQRRELEWAMKPTLRDRASYVPRTFTPIADAGRFQLIEGDREIIPGVSVRRMTGHTPNLQGVIITGGGETAVFPSDLIPTSRHLPPPWVMGYDLEPLVAMEHKIELLEEVVEKRWIVIFEHDPDTPMGRVRYDERQRPLLEPVS
jgi:glyoxylase-like metal-dependent hydrolase (beta-lactamase superfamily II)